MDSFVAAHRRCSFEKGPDAPPGVQAPCLGPTTIWAATIDPTQPAGVSVSLRQLAPPHNEYAVQAHHKPTGWVIISIALIDA
jgi:hypothetical protein